MRKIIVNLECITNMHVGNGDVNFNIIDKEVERDVVSGYPTINASGVKGALREYFVKRNIDVNDIFGDDKTKTAGKLKFLCANMLALPMRASKGDKPYYLISTKEALAEYDKFCEMVGVEKVNKIESNVKENIGVEGVEISEKVSFTDKNNNVKDIFFMSHEAFRNVSLPVVARNCLENGKSVNLWYEEIVPHKSLFYFVVMEEDSDKDCLDLFINTVNEKIIQFGGNASIGYGLCKVSVTEGKNNE